MALLVERSERAPERAHLERLCAHFAVAAPAAEALHCALALGPVNLSWERHGEFSSYTFFMPGAGAQPFAEPAIERLPPGWLAGVPGATLYAAHAELLAAGDAPPDAETLAAYFADPVAGAEIADGAALAYTDFRVHADGFARFMVLDRRLTRRQAGRTLKRLFEIETYRVMALLALPVARTLMPRIAEIEEQLALLTREIAGADTDDEHVLGQLTRLAAEVEGALTAHQSRFAACHAYQDLVATRVGELRERRLPGVQTIEEFMTYRFRPATATVASTARRLHALAERVGQLSALLSASVDIVRERQNQSLLESMDRRAAVQLRLQQAVESLSLVAIVYYGAGLVAYLAKAAKAVGFPVAVDAVVGAAIPAIAVLCLWVVARLHRRRAGKGPLAAASTRPRA